MDTRRIGLIVGLAVVFGIGGVALWRRPQKRFVPALPPVVTPAVSEVNLPARVIPKNIASVGAPIDGVFESFFVQPGVEVYAGQLLGRIRNAALEAAQQQAQAEVDQAEVRMPATNAGELAAKLEITRAEAEQGRARADLDRLEKDYQRMKGLWAAGAVARLVFEKSEKDYKDAAALVEKLDAASKQAAERADQLARDGQAANQAIGEKTKAVERAKAALTAEEIHSPVDGIVIALHGEPGQAVDPSMKDLAEIGTGLASLVAIATPDPEVLARIRTGQPATVRYGDAEVGGVVREIRGSDVIVDFTLPSAPVKFEPSAQVRIKF